MPARRWALSGRSAEDIRAGYRKAAVGSHVMFYRVRADVVEIVRILHRNMDVGRHIQPRFGDELRWQRLDERKSSRISYSHPFDGFDAENWPEMIEWLCRHLVRLDEAFSKALARLNQQVKSPGGTMVGDQIAAASVSDA